MKTRKVEYALTIDILVNNAGFERIKLFLEVDEILWNSMIDTNLKADEFG